MGDLVVKVRRDDRAGEKTRWCAAYLPVLGARGYPVPEIVWHGSLGRDWYAAVQRAAARPDSVDAIAARILAVASHADALCLAAYRAIAQLASLRRRSEEERHAASVVVAADAVLARLA